MSSDFLDFVGLPTTSEKARGYCRPCRRVLQIDVGVSVKGMPAAWYHCSGCGTNYCPVDPNHKAKPRSWSWDDGVSTDDGVRVPCCNEGFCGKLLAECERFLVAFSSSPSGQEARDAAKTLRIRAAHGREQDWGTHQAQALLRVYEWFTAEKKRREELERESAAAQGRAESARRMAAVRAEMDAFGIDPALDWASRHEALTTAKKAARAAETTRRDAEFSREFLDVLLPEGTDEDMIRADRWSRSAKIIEDAPDCLDKGALADTVLELLRTDC